MKHRHLVGFHPSQSHVMILIKYSYGIMLQCTLMLLDLPGMNVILSVPIYTNIYHKIS